jgi:hypothetical protein
LQFDVLTLPDEDLDMDADQVARDSDQHGRIEVKIWRGDNIVTKTKQTRPTLFNGYDPPNTHVSSKAVVKDGHVSHAIR